MKKFLIIITIIIVLIIVIGVISRSGSQPEEEITEGSTQVEEASQLLPADITVGIYDPAGVLSNLNQLLESRLKEIGFQTVILPELVDPEAANSAKTTLLFRSDTQEALDVVIREIIKSTVFRKGQNEAILEEVVLASWNIEDINWGELQEVADEFLHPDSDQVSVLVLNSGAEPGSAGQVASLLKEAGYAQAAAANAEEEAIRPVLIYYQRNFKEIAKDLRKLLSGEGYPKVTYRARLEQEANIVVVLGPLPEEEESEISN